MDYGDSSAIYASVGKILADKDIEDLELYKNKYQVLTKLHPKGGDTRVVRKIAGWRDPTTPPQSKTDCVKDCHITPWDTECCGWAVRWRYMDCELFVQVVTKTPQDIVGVLENCLQQSTIVGLISGIVTAVMTGGGGVAAAESAFVAALTACLSDKLTDIVSVSLLESCGWSDWS